MAPFSIKKMIIKQPENIITQYVSLSTSKERPESYIEVPLQNHMQMAMKKVSPFLQNWQGAPILRNEAVYAYSALT